MTLRRSGRRMSSRLPRSGAREPRRRSWMQGWGLKTAVISAVVPLVVAALWAKGAGLVDRRVSPAPSVSGSVTPVAAAGGQAPGPSASPSPVGPAPDGSPSAAPPLPPEPIWDPTGPPSGGPTSRPDPTSKPKPPPPSDGAGVSARVRRSGTLVMADYTAYDLDSTAADWNPTKDDWGSSRDVGYASWWPDADNDAVVSREDPRYAASLPGTGPWQRADCVRAGYGQPSARPVGERLLERRGICVVTSAGRYALLVVSRAVEKQLTVRVTVWE
ncbi:hypothetical protein ACH4OY_15070 [Micromonospora rubida]|uniref:Uncharacterized protein n=1 Tax=Micromonospora rubida TaxID=2697657 RepID=A0ABW7SM77_9ACTN